MCSISKDKQMHRVLFTWVFLKRPLLFIVTQCLKPRGPAVSMKTIFLVTICKCSFVAAVRNFCGKFRLTLGCIPECMVESHW